MNLVQANRDNAQDVIDALVEEKTKLLERLGQVYAEEARVRFIQDALNATKHFTKEAP